MPRWALYLPLAAAVVLLTAALLSVGPVLATICGAALAVAVVAAVHHAEIVALRVGEPFGTLVLALAVTVIEVALILSVMISAGADRSSLPRDTVFATVMIICNGVVGLCLLLGGLRHREQEFSVHGANSALACLVALACLSLVLPTFTTTVPGSVYSPSQLAFAGLASLTLWGVFVFIQTVRHRDYFLPTTDSTDEEAHVAAPTAKVAWASLGLLLVCLVVVVGLAKMLAPTIERIVAAAGAPIAVIGIIIAMLVLLPETWAAARAARANRLQTSLNLALGSALATIGLTIPAVALASVWLNVQLVLGLEPVELALLALTFLVSAITLTTGRTTVMQGAVHLVLFAAFLFLAVVP